MSLMTLTPSRRRRSIAVTRVRRAQAGLSLVELLIGVALGLFIVAGAATLGGSMLSENRRLLLETQVQQDLRATADIILRELRRTAAPADIVSTMWLPDAPNTMPSVNPLAGPTVESGDVISYKYDRIDSPSSDLGFTYANNTIYSRVGTATAQPLTDRNTLRVTTFTVAEQNGPTLQLACDKLCADGTQACWPTIRAREFLITITGTSATDASVQRSLTSRVRIRNDALQFNAAGAVCPT